MFEKRKFIEETRKKVEQNMPLFLSKDELAILMSQEEALRKKMVFELHIEDYLELVDLFEECGFTINDADEMAVLCSGMNCKYE